MTQTIALIDDDRNILTSLSIALEKEGFKVQTYLDGESALIGLTRTPPDLAIVDIKMPKMYGEELLKKLRKKNIELKNNNVISNAPHTLKELIADNWHYPYTKEKASFPYKTPTSIKFWSSVSRIDNAYGDRNLICSCYVNQDETLEEKKCA